MSVSRFLVIGAAILLVPLGGAAVPLYRAAGPRVAGGVIFGSLAAAAGAGIWLVCWGLSRWRGQKAFLGFLFGGILVRLTLLGAATVAVLATGALHLPSFIASLFIYYIVFQIMEIRLVRHAQTAAAPSGTTAG